MRNRMGTSKIFPVAICFFSLIVWAQFPLSAQNPVDRSKTSTPIALVNGFIIDGTGNDPIINGVIVIAADKIIAVGKKNEVLIPSNYKVIDLQGATILPGLINAHVHNAYFERHAAIWASCGVTTVRDLSCGRNEVERSIAFRNQARSNPKLCRIISAGAMIIVPWGYKAEYGITVKSEIDARIKVKMELEAGVDCLKITLQEPSFPQFTNLSLKLATFIVSLAFKLSKSMQA